MKLNEFNETTKLTRYSYAPSPVHPRAFLILKKDNILDDPRPVGDYTVLDKEEDMGLAEKKVINLISLLNEKPGKVIHVGDKDGGRMLFHVISERDEENKLKVMFYVNKGEGTSKEHALFRVEHDEQIWN